MALAVALNSVLSTLSFRRRDVSFLDRRTLHFPIRFRPPHHLKLVPFGMEDDVVIDFMLVDYNRMYKLVLIEEVPEEPLAGLDHKQLA